MDIYSNYVGYTTKSNTPFTDTQPRIWCTVTYVKNEQACEEQAYASDPLDAIEMVQRRHRENEHDYI